MKRDFALLEAHWGVGILKCPSEPSYNSVVKIYNLPRKSTEIHGKYNWRLNLVQILVWLAKILQEPISNLSV
jgi:hypothetical protein